jgi:hypothetical protein
MKLLGRGAIEGQEKNRGRVFLCVGDDAPGAGMTSVIFLSRQGGCEEDASSIMYFHFFISG